MVINMYNNDTTVVSYRFDQFENVFVSSAMSLDSNETMVLATTDDVVYEVSRKQKDRGCMSIVIR